MNMKYISWKTQFYHVQIVLIPILLFSANPYKKFCFSDFLREDSLRGSPKLWKILRKNLQLKFYIYNHIYEIQLEWNIHWNHPILISWEVMTVETDQNYFLEDENVL